MINIYNYIPESVIKSELYINDIDIFFSHRWNKAIQHKEAKRILKDIEDAEIKHNDIIKGKFGITIINKISTGTKALLLALSYPKYLVNFTEAGDNIFNLAIKLSEKYNMNIMNNEVRVVDNLRAKIKFNGKEMQLWEMMGKVEI